MTTKHTPTPWHADYSGAFGRVNDADNNRIADVNAGLYDNAAHIVKCVNTHDELVAALEEMCNGPLLIDDANASLQTREDAMRRYKQARAVLAKVKP